jgi:hypothetical protein
MVIKVFQVGDFVLFQKAEELPGIPVVKLYRVGMVTQRFQPLFEVFAYVLKLVTFYFPVNIPGGSFHFPYIHFL